MVVLGKLVVWKLCCSWLSVIMKPTCYYSRVVKVATEWKSLPASSICSLHKNHATKFIVCISKHFCFFSIISMHNGTSGWNLISNWNFIIYAVTSPKVMQWTQNSLFLLHSVWASTLSEPTLWNIFMSDGCFYLPQNSYHPISVCAIIEESAYAHKLP